MRATNIVFLTSVFESLYSSHFYPFAISLKPKNPLYERVLVNINPDNLDLIYTTTRPDCCSQRQFQFFRIILTKFMGANVRHASHSVKPKLYSHTREIRLKIELLLIENYLITPIFN